MPVSDLKAPAADIASMDASDPAWEVEATREIYSNGFFRLRRDRCVLTKAPTVATHHYVLEMSDLAIVVPVTASGELVMVEQFRHGANRWFIEFPGGTVDGADRDPQESAVRELREETGYVAEELLYLGAHHLNPSAQTNKVHTYLARGCQQCLIQELEKFEDMRVCLVTLDDIYQRTLRGDNIDSVTLASLMLALPLLTRQS